MSETLLKHAVPVAFLYGADRQKMIDFYCGTLGYALKSADEHGDFIDLGPALVRLTIFPDYKAGQFPVFGWHVADIDADVRRFAALGIAFLRYDFLEQDEQGVWTAPDGKAKVAWFNDVEGNLLSLSQG